MGVNSSMNTAANLGGELLHLLAHTLILELNERSLDRTTSKIFSETILQLRSE